MATTTIPWAGQLPYNSGGNVPLGELANNTNQFMTNQSILPFLQNLPGYANAVGQRSENTQQMLQGQLPQDVVNQISTRAAERGIAGGSPGGPNANAAYLSALGLNSLQMMNQGSQQLSQSIQDTPVPELWNPMSLYVPSTLAAQEQAAALAGQKAQISANKANSAPAPKLTNQWMAQHDGTYYSNYYGMGF
jgi:hypothetical protein